MVYLLLILQNEKQANKNLNQCQMDRYKGALKISILRVNASFSKTGHICFLSVI